MKKIKIGLQSHSVREAFAEDYRETIRRVAEMGYDGMELVDTALNQTPEDYAAALKENGLECLGCMLSAPNIQGEAFEKMLKVYKALGAKSTVICSVSREDLREGQRMIREAGLRMLQEGYLTGYHSHDSDSVRMEDGRSFYEYVMDSMPQDFAMVIDTGNTMGGGDDPIALLKKYPGRTPVLHLKGYSQEKGYTTPVWESELDMEKLLEVALDTCGTETIIIEFGKRGDYEPFDRAEKSLVWLKQLLTKMGRI